MQTKPIPCSGEPLGVIGLGTYVGFDVNGRGADAQLQQVLHNLLDPGGSVIDSSPMYGRAEGVTGELLAASATGKRTFLATKVWTRGEQAGIAQMNRSMELLRTDRLDLMQVHNLLDWRVHLKTMRRMKEAGRIRHIGVTHYTSSAYAELETVLRAEPLDFVQLNYSVMDRAAEQRLLPLALERRVAVLANLPLASGSALRAVVSRPLPAVAGELGCTSWAQLLLKFVVSHPAVTCAIPGTSRPEHMADNAAEGSARLRTERSANASHARTRLDAPGSKHEGRKSMTSENAAIEQTLWTYLDGLHEGDADKIAAAFHPVSHLYSEQNGEVADVPRDKWLDMVRARPSAKSQGHPRHDRIVTIDQSGPVSAFAKVECALPPRFFVDYLTLLKTRDGWRIVAKAFKTETR